MSIIENLSPLEVLALTLIGEARGEPIEGIVAVGCVIRNRMHDAPARYHSYNDVCLEPKQFSCWNPNDVNYPLLLDLANQMITGQNLQDPYIRQCLWVARGIEDWSLLDNTGGAINYVSNLLFNSPDRPSWVKKAHSISIKGNQTFFTV